MQVLALSSNGRKESDRCGLPDDRADRFVVFERSSLLEPRLAKAGEVAWRLIRRGEPPLGELTLWLLRFGERECCLPIGELRAEQREVPEPREAATPALASPWLSRSSWKRSCATPEGIRARWPKIFPGMYFFKKTRVGAALTLASHAHGPLMKTQWRKKPMSARMVTLTYS